MGNAGGGLLQGGSHGLGALQTGEGLFTGDGSLGFGAAEGQQCWLIRAA